LPPNVRDAKRLLGKKIATLRKHLGMSRAAFGQRLGVSQMAVYRWETEADVPASKKLFEIARLAPDDQRWFFLQSAGVDKAEVSEWFSSGGEPSNFVTWPQPHQGEEKLPKRMGDLVEVKVLKDPAAAGQPRFIDETEIASFILVPNSKELAPHPSALVAVRVEGDSMSPFLNDGYIAVIDTADNSRKALYNDMVAVRDPEGAVTIKWLRRNGPDEILVAHHTSVRHQPMVITGNDDWKVIGKVVWWIGKPPSKKLK